MKKRLAAAGLAVLLLSACGKSVLEFETTPVYSNLHAVNAAEENTATGSMTVGENECVLINSDLSKGEVNIVFKDHTGNIELSETFDGIIMNVYDITPGEYDVSATVLDKASGDIQILVLNEDEIDREQFSLKDALEEAGVSLD